MAGDCDLLVNKYRHAGLVLLTGCAQVHELFLVSARWFLIPWGLHWACRRISSKRRDWEQSRRCRCPPFPTPLPGQAGFLNRQTFLPHLLQVPCGSCLPPLFLLLLPAMQRAVRCLGLVWALPQTDPSLSSSSPACGRPRGTLSWHLCVCPHICTGLQLARVCTCVCSHNLAAGEQGVGSWATHLSSLWTLFFSR